MTKFELIEKTKIAEIQTQKKEKIHKSLEASIKDAMAYNTMQGAGVNFITPFAVSLKASNFQISLLSSLPQLLSAWIQIFSAELVEKFKNRKKIINFFVLLQALTWLPILAIPFFFLEENAVWFLILFYTLFAVFGAIINPIWQSLMGDLVPVEERGSYFGKRNTAAGIMTLLSTLIAGTFLNLFPKGSIFYAFAVLFSTSFLMRLISRHYLGKMYEPLHFPNPKARFSFKQFVSKMASNNFGNFVLFVSFFRIAEYIATPFFAVYMLSYLKFDYLTFTIITIAPLISSLIVMKQWGRISDIFGNRKIMMACGLMVIFVPAYWILVKNPIILFLCEFFISGIFWAGFNLSASNFIYDTTTPEKRTRCVSYFNTFTGTGAFIGALTGGIIASSSESLSFITTNLHLVFIVSFIVRIGVFAFFVKRIREVKQVKEITDSELYYQIIVDNNLTGFTADIITTIKTKAEKPIKKIAKNFKTLGKAVEYLNEEFEKTIKKTIKTADKIIKKTNKK